MLSAPTPLAKFLFDSTFCRPHHRCAFQRTMKISPALLCTLGFILFAGTSHADTLRVAGAPTIGFVMADAAPILREEDDIEFIISTDGGSAGGVNALGTGNAQ